MSHPRVIQRGGGGGWSTDGRGGGWGGGVLMAEGVEY